MNKKYYPPDSNEFHLGFNYEIDEGKLLFSKWIKYTFDIYDANIIHTDNEYGVRVKYIDEDDIENCEFELIRKWESNNIRNWLFKKRLNDDYDWMVQLILPKNKFFEIENILIFTKDLRISENDETTYFNGTIKNIDEFKFILKRIGAIK